MKKVVIIGAGIAGLTTAYRLEDSGFRVTLVDSRPRVGGVIETVRERGFVVEGGPDSFITMKPWARDLCLELGLEKNLIPLAHRGFFVQSAGQLHPFPDGMMLTVPTRVWPLLKSSLLSFTGKMRMGMDRFLPRGKEVEDESIGDFIRRRLGKEALEKLAEPLMAGIYMAPADRLSLQTTFPRFADMEKKHRSLIKAMKKAPAPSGTSPFLSLKGGMSELVERLRFRLRNTTIITGRPVLAIRPGYKVVLEGDTLEATDVVLATPAPAAAKLLEPLNGELASMVSSIPTSGSATVSLGFRRDQVTHALNGTGFVIPAAERKNILACTWSSQKFNERAPDHHVLLRCFLGGADRDEIIDGGDEELIRLAYEDVKAALGTTGDPVLARVFRWPTANPIYEVGHQKKVSEIEDRLPDGIHLAGCAYRGIGLPDGVRDATTLAKKLKET